MLFWMVVLTPVVCGAVSLALGYAIDQGFWMRSVGMTIATLLVGIPSAIRAQRRNR